jgi:competence protein ComEC
VNRADLRLLPGATCLWALAVLGVTVGGAAAVAAGAVLVSLALTALALLGPARGARTVLAHLALVVLAGLLLVPALHRHDDTADALGEAAAEGSVVELTLTAGADPAPPSGGPDWSRTGLQMRARTVPGPASIGREQVALRAAVPVLVRADGEAAADLARIRDGEPATVRGRVGGDAALLVLRATEVRPAPGSGGPGHDSRHRLRGIAREERHVRADRGDHAPGRDLPPGRGQRGEHRAGPRRRARPAADRRGAAPPPPADRGGRGRRLRVAGR